MCINQCFDSGSKGKYEGLIRHLHQKKFQGQGRAEGPPQRKWLAACRVCYTEGRPEFLHLNVDRRQAEVLHQVRNKAPGCLIQHQASCVVNNRRAGEVSHYRQTTMRVPHQMQHCRTAML